MFQEIRVKAAASHLAAGFHGALDALRQFVI
jgi:hypothetical protein